MSCFRLLRPTFSALPGFPLPGFLPGFSLRISLGLGLALFLGVAPLVAQGPSPGAPDLLAQRDLDARFARQLRLEGQSDLAVDFLQGTMARYPVELRDPLIMMLASSRIDAAASIPDSETRRRAMLQGQAELEGFLARNPKSPFGLQASMDLAQVAVRLGEVQMARALTMDPKVPGAQAEKDKARSLLNQGIQKTEQLFVRLAQVEQGALDSAGMTPGQIQEAKLLAKLQIAGAQFQLARLFNDPEKESAQRIEAIDVAFKSFDTLAALDPQSPICWKALAWAAFLLKEKGEPKKAREVIKVILAAKDTNPAVKVGKAWARYFLLRIIKEDPEPSERNQANKMVLDGIRQWQTDFKQFREPQGDDRLRLGLKMLQAQATYDQVRALNPRDATSATEKNRQLASARLLARELEQGDHEFSEAIRKLKILIVGEQGVFQKKPEALNTFEDCFIRAQYEAQQMDLDPSREKDPAKRNELRKERTKTIIDSVTRGLELDLKAAPTARANSWEKGNARLFLAYFLKQDGQLEQAADVTETLVRNDPKASQAERAGILALTALAQAHQDKEKELGKNDAKSQALKKRLESLASYLIQRWPDSAAGFSAKHQLALLKVRDRQSAEAIPLFESIPEGYDSIAYVRYQLGLAALEAAGDLKDSPMRVKAISAFEAIPDASASDDPGTALVYFLGKLKLAGEYYTARRFLETIQLTGVLGRQLPKARLDPDGAKSRDLQGKLTINADTLRLFASQSQAGLWIKENKLKEALDLINPIIQQIKDGQNEAVKKDPNLASGFLNLALRASIQGRDIARAREILAVMRQMDTAGGDQAAKTQLALVYSLASQVAQDLKAISDPAQKEGLQKGMAAVIEEMAVNAPKWNAENTRILALSFGALGLHKRAVEVLQAQVDKVQAEMKADPAKFKQDGVGQALLFTFVKELRYDGRAAEARAFLEDWMGTTKSPGWAANSVEARIERLYQLDLEEKYGEAANQANTLVRQMVNKASDNLYKERYLEAYWHMVQAFWKYGKSKMDSGQMDRAASLMVQLLKNWPDYGSADSKARFEALLAAEPDLKVRMEAVQTKAKQPVQPGAKKR